MNRAKRVQFPHIAPNFYRLSSLAEKHFSIRGGNGGFESPLGRLIFKVKIMKQKGEITIAGETHEVEVRDGIRLIDGKSVDEFLSKLTQDDVRKLAEVGKQALIDEKLGSIRRPNQYQDALINL